MAVAEACGAAHGGASCLEARKVPNHVRMVDAHQHGHLLFDAADLITPIADGDDLAHGAVARTLRLNQEGLASRSVPDHVHDAVVPESIAVLQRVKQAHASRLRTVPSLKNTRQSVLHCVGRRARLLELAIELLHLRFVLCVTRLQLTREALQLGRYRCKHGRPGYGPSEQHSDRESAAMPREDDGQRLHVA